MAAAALLTALDELCLPLLEQAVVDERVDGIPLSTCSKRNASSVLMRNMTAITLASRLTSSSTASASCVYRDVCELRLECVAKIMAKSCSRPWRARASPMFSATHHALPLAEEEGERESGDGGEVAPRSLHRAQMLHERHLIYDWLREHIPVLRWMKTQTTAA